jgi:hypothetical protein
MKQEVSGKTKADSGMLVKFAALIMAVDGSVK